MEDIATESQRARTILKTDNADIGTSAETLVEIATLTGELAEVREKLRHLAADLDERRSALNASFVGLQREKQRLTARTKHKEQSADDPALTQLVSAVRHNEANHARRLTEFESALRIVEREHGRLRAQSRSLEQRRETLVARLPSAAVSRYQSLVSRRIEQPVAMVVGNACGGCGAYLRRLRSENLQACTSCGRLLITSPAPPHASGRA